MGITLYYFRGSTADVTNRVLAELGVDHEKVMVDLPGGGTHTPDFLKLNPNGKIPVLVHDGTPLWEAAAITLYLGETFGVQAGVYPAPGPKRGEVMKWVVWGSVSLAEAFSRWATQAGKRDVPSEQLSSSALKTAEKDLKEHMTILNDALAEAPFLLGEYTLADTHVQSFHEWFDYYQMDWSSYPNVEPWIKRCNERPGLAKLIAAQKQAPAHE